MRLKTAAALMFISLVGPPISGFNPEICVKEWLKKGHHHSDYTSCTASAEKSRKISISENIWKISERYVKQVDFLFVFKTSLSIYS
jgi:hypothetical protein